MAVGGREPVTILVPLTLFGWIPVVFLLFAVMRPQRAVIVAFLVGAQFPLASKLHFKGVSQTAAVLYNADLFGACIGALLVSALLVPLFGLVFVCGIVASFDAASLLIVIIKRRSLCRGT